MAWCGTAKSKEGYGSTAICGQCVESKERKEMVVEPLKHDIVKHDIVELNCHEEKNELEYLDVGSDSSNAKIFNCDAIYQNVQVDSVDLQFSMMRGIHGTKHFLFFRTMYNSPPYVSYNLRVCTNYYINLCII
jgi:hypothetical protein